MPKVLMCDPPTGWRYGFPRPMPNDFMTEEETKNWLIENGYPVKLTENLPYCRYWEEDVEQ